MRRLFGLVCASALIAALPLSHGAFGGRDSRVPICHATDAFDVPQNQYTLIVGRVIRVSENAVDAHLAHGDSLAINDIDDGPIIFGLTWREIAENVGLRTKNANCAAFIVDVD